MVYTKGNEFCVFLHAQVGASHPNRQDIIIYWEWLKFWTGKFCSFVGCSGYKVFKLVMLKILALQLFSTMYEGLVRCTV